MVQNKVSSFFHFHLEELSDRLEPEQIQKVANLLTKWKHVFSVNPGEYVASKSTEHTIRLNDDQPFKERHRRIPPHLFDEVREHIQEMVDAKIIRKSYSPYSSSIVLVRKRDGTLRFCVDFRKLNAKTIKDAHYIPRIDETLDLLKGAKWFSSLDLKAGYWQVPIAEAD